MQHVMHEDDRLVDFVEITVHERWKESELSGDEWRFTYHVVLGRKGRRVAAGFSQLQWALDHADRVAAAPGPEDTEATVAVRNALVEDDGTSCDQPGCAAPAVRWYVRKKDWIAYSRGAANKETEDGQHFRRFCEKHTHRGDCGLDDADANYDEVAKEQVQP